VEGLRAAVDGDVRVLALEGVDQRLDRVVLRAAHLLVPHREGDVAEGVDVGVDLVGGGGGRLAGILRAGGAGGQEAEAAQRSSGAEEIPSSHHVLLRWAAPPAPARARSLPATAAGRSPMISPGRCYRDGAMKLTILGGGGFRVPLVYEAVATAATGLTVDEVALHDVDPARLRTITAVIEGIAERLRADGHGPILPRLTATTELREAVTGADFGFSAVRVGGAAARTARSAPRCAPRAGCARPWPARTSSSPPCGWAVRRPARSTSAWRWTWGCWARRRSAPEASPTRCARSPSPSTSPARSRRSRRTP